MRDDLKHQPCSPDFSLEYGVRRLERTIVLMAQIAMCKGAASDDGDGDERGSKEKGPATD